MAESSLLPFTPRLLQLLQRHCSSSSSPTAAIGGVESPLRVSLPSALLFIDVSGFTSLTESMSQKGASGLEQLTQTLNAFFSTILDVIRHHRGDLLKVAGDALIVAFYDEDAVPPAANHLSPSHTSPPSSSPTPPTDGVLSLLTLRALRAALALQSKLAADGSFPLRLHIGATCGLTDYICVGGEEQSWAVGGLTADIVELDPPIPIPPMLPLGPAGVTEPPSPSTCSTAASPHSASASAASVPSAASHASALSTFSSHQLATSLASDPPSPPSPSLPPPVEQPPPLLGRVPPRPLHIPRVSLDRNVFLTYRQGGSRWEFLAVGPPVEDLNTAVRDSKTGELVCSQQLWKRVAEVARVQGTPLDNGTGNWRVTACEPLDGALTADVRDGWGDGYLREKGSAQSGSVLPSLASFVMPALLSRMQTGLSTPSHWLGEYRRVTVLFISLPNPHHCQPPSTTPPHLSHPTVNGEVASANSPISETASPPPPSTASPHSPSAPSSSSSSTSPTSASPTPASIAVPGWLYSFHQVVRTMQRAIFTLGGQVRQCLQDDKGAALICAFGLPPLAQEDDAARAVMAALEILSAVRAHHPQVASSVSVGATTGRVWCGAVGSDRRKEYAVVGNIVNLAARIMGDASTRQRVMCDEETMRACGGRVEFSPVTRQVSVKGRVEAVTLYEPVGKARLSFSQPSTLSPQSLSGSPKRFPALPGSATVDPSSRNLSRSGSLSTPTASMVPSPVSPKADWTSAFASPVVDEGLTLHSRDAALNRIASLLIHSATETEADSTESPPRPSPVVVLEGGAGQGKTFLTGQVVEQCRDAGLHVLIGTADSIEANSPFFAIALVLQDVVRLELSRLQHLQADQPTAFPLPGVSSISASAHSALLSLLPELDRPYVSLLYPFLPECDLGKQTSSTVVEVSLRPVFTRRLMRSLLLAHCSRYPSTVVLIEDGHWVDLQGWTLLRELTELIPSFRLYLTCRPIPAPDSLSPASLSSPSASLWTMYAAVTEHPRCHHFVLAGLDQPTTTALAVSFLGCRALHPALAATIHQRSDGVPLFIQHLCSYLREAHLLTVHPTTGVASLNELLLANVALPSSLEGLLASVLDRLHPDCQLTLKVASVVGRHFSLSVVAACHPLSVSQAWLQSMMALAEQQRIVERESRAEAEWGQLQPHSGGTDDSANEEGEEDEAGGDRRRDYHYRFTHQLVRDAAYSSLLYQQRRDLHAEVADHLRLLSGRNLSSGSISGPQVSPPSDLRSASSASAHLLAHHYWLAVCSSGNVLTETPDQRLLECAVEYLLETASTSRQLGAMDAVGLLLCLAARGLRRLLDEEKRDVLQVRWLYLVLGSDILYNLPLVQMLAIELGDARSGEEGGPHAIGSRCLRTFAHRMLALLTARAVSQDLNPLQLQDHRFIGLYAMWYASLSLGPAVALPAFEALREMAAAAVGPDAGYYQLEALCTAFSAYAQAHDSAGSFRSFTELETHPFYLSMLRGDTKVTRFTLGYSPMSRLMPNQAVFQWERGYVTSSRHTLQRIMPMMQATEHAPTIGQGWTQVMRASMLTNSCPLTVQLLQQAVAAYPAQDSTATHQLYTFRQCCLMTLRVWGHGQQSSVVAESSDSLPPIPASGGLGGVEYEADLLSFIAQLSEQGGAFGMMFYLIIHYFPLVIDFRPEVPTSVYEALLALMLKYHRIFSYNAWDIEIERFKAEIIIRRLHSDTVDGPERQAQMEEAERLLRDAAALVRFERMLALKLRMTGASLALLTGRVEEGRERLKSALDDLPEAADSECFHVTRAKRLLRDLDAAQAARKEQLT